MVIIKKYKYFSVLFLLFIQINSFKNKSILKSKMAESKKRKHITLEEKYLTIQRIEKDNLNHALVAAELGIDRSTVTKWCGKERSNIEQAYTANKPATRKKLRKSKYELIEDSLLEWFTQTRATNQNVPINGPILLAKAADFAVLHNEPDFKSSTGWLYRWLQRNNISLQNMNGESAKVDNSTVNDWISKLSKMIEGYKPEDIFNADETGLFFKCMPQKTYGFKGQKCYNGEKSKERLTILFTCNSTGTEKLTPVVIGKSENPRAFKNVNKANLGVYYRSNTKAWMTSKLFSEWLVKINKQFLQQNRKILLFLDNFSGHYTENNRNLTNIKIIYFPPNCTSKLQPLDAGIIANFKLRYRSNIVQKMIESLDNECPIQNINIKDAIEMLVRGWKLIPESCIRNCFIKSGFNASESDLTIENENVQLLSNTSILYNELCQRNKDTYSIPLDEYVNCDSELNVAAQVDENTIAQDTSTKHQQTLLQNENEDDEEDEVEPKPVPSRKQVIDALELARYFLQCQDKDTSSELAKIDEVLCVVESSTKLVQKKIHDFFV